MRMIRDFYPGFLHRFVGLILFIFGCFRSGSVQAFLAFHLCLILVFNMCFLLFYFQSSNTHSQRLEREKEMEKEKDKDLESDVEEVADADLSLMDRTKRQAKAARELTKKRSKALSSAEEDVLDLEEMLAQAQQKADATKAARARAADLRRQLQALQDDEDAMSDQDHLPLQAAAPAAVPAPAPATVPADVASALAVSLQSAVICFLFNCYV